MLGTAAYISPEQAMGDAATAASDRYALAVVAFELLTGTRPFEAEHFAAQARAHVEDVPPAAVRARPDLPRAVDACCWRGLAKDPERPLADRGRVRRRARGRAGRAAPRDDGTDGDARAAADAAPARRRRRAAAGAAHASRSPRRRAAALMRARGARRSRCSWPPERRRCWPAAAAARDKRRRSADGRRPRHRRAGRSAPPTPTPTATATATPAATATATATRDADGDGDGDATEPSTATGGDAAALQRQAFDLNNAGRSQAALPAGGQGASTLCKGSDTASSPCAYALFEYAPARYG